MVETGSGFCLCPQGVRTPMTEAEGELAVEVVKAMGMIEPEEVADAVAVGLANDEFLILLTPKSSGTSSGGPVTEHGGWRGCKSFRRRSRAAEVSLDPETAAIYREKARVW